MNIAKSGYGKVVLPHQIGREISGQRLDIVRFLMVCMVMLMVVSIFHVWSRFRLIELNLQIGDASRQMKELVQEQKRLNLEAESLRTPARIEAISKGELGMMVPKDDQIVQVK